MGVKLGAGGYRSKMAAEFAGARGLRDFLAALADERTRAMRAEKRIESPREVTALRHAVV